MPDSHWAALSASRNKSFKEIFVMHLPLSGIYISIRYYISILTLLFIFSLKFIEFYFTVHLTALLFSCRPRGHHHAVRNEACGFCYFNNVALCAKHCIDQLHLKR